MTEQTNSTRPRATCPECGRTAAVRKDGRLWPHRPPGEAAPCDGSWATTYDPEDDNCAGSPECGQQRVLFRWYGAAAAACPRCYRNIFGGEPDHSRIINIPDGQPGAAA